MTSLGLLAPCIGIAFGAFHLVFFRWLLGGLRKSAPTQKSQIPSSVTVVVAARNEERNLRSLIPILLAQEHSGIELQVVVVDDRSDDGTPPLLSSYADRIDSVRVDSLPPGIGPKKHALARGLQLARGEIILQLDADNVPGPQWVAEMARHFGPTTGCVCGLVLHGPRGRQTPEWFHGIWALEATGWAAVQNAAIGAGMPISANGGNLAYRRKAFDAVNGFRAHQHVVSGDDDFLVQALADSGTWDVVSVQTPASWVETEPPGDWHQVWEQRKRWGSKCLRYDPKRVGLLALVYLSYLWVAIGLVVGFFHPWIGVGAGITFVAVLAEAFFLTLAMARRTGRAALIRWFPLAMAIQIPVVLGATLMGTFGRFRWKGQTVGAKA